MIVLLLSLCIPLCASAATHIYAAASPVSDQSAASRSKAFSQDLAKVLVKVSGDPATARYAASMDAGRLVVGYRFRKARGEHASGLELWARFDERGVNAALAGLGEPVWGKGRPTVIAWVTAPGGMVGGSGGNPLAKAMRKSAQQRGLPLVLPLLDLTDQQAVSSFDISSFFLPALEKASKRYDARAILVGAIKKSGDSVSSSWQLEVGENTKAFPVAAPSAESAAAAAVGKATTLIAQRYARVPSVGGTGSALALVVDGVNSIEAEAAVRRAVSDVQGVQSLKLSRVKGETLRFLVAYDGSKEEFARHLALSSRLSQSDHAPTLAPPAGSRSRPVVSFHYSP